MLTEGWDCKTVTHIVGLRPFMSQLLCEQVVGRGLRRTRYEIGPNDRLSEEIAKVFGVPFEIVPFKTSPPGTATPPEKRYHVHALPNREEFEIRFPRIEGYLQAIRNRVTVNWGSLAAIHLDPIRIPPEVEMKAGLPNNQGRYSLTGPGAIARLDLNPYRKGRRLQELAFELAKDLTRDFGGQPQCQAPIHVLFPQIAAIVSRYLNEKIIPTPPADRLDIFLSPYYGWVIERLLEAIQPDTAQGEAPEVPRYESGRGPGSTAEVDFWTSKEVREVVKSHVNFIVADTQVWEQSAAYAIDTHSQVEAFVKNAGLGFTIPYLHNGQPHDYVPDFIIRLKSDPLLLLILETKGYDELADIKAQAAQRWVKAVNLDGRFGTWLYALAKHPGEVASKIDEARNNTAG
jgi:type III restriction enzyme